MFKIFAEAHKVIANELYENFKGKNIDLDIKSLKWGSILPDLLPKYKFIRHYKEESLKFISQEIVNLIYQYRNIDLYKLDPITKKILSKKLGIISHYLADYTCLPHAERWTFQDNMLKHLKYESKLNDLVKNHKFNKELAKIESLSIVNLDNQSLTNYVSDFIEKTISIYNKKQKKLSDDLDFALILNLKVVWFIFDTIEIYSNEIEGQIIYSI